MISAQDAIRVGRSLLGTSYDELDCINFIKAIIRGAPGGVKGYTTAGTNSLWRSYEASAKYRDLTWRQEGIAGAQAGMLAFKRSGSDVHHVGLCTGEGTVLHSSSALGKVVETDLAGGQWALLAIHRYIAVSDQIGTGEEDEPMSVLYQALVNTERDPLRVRAFPITGEIVGRVPRGRTVDVLVDGENGWPYIRYGELVGYASGDYLTRLDGAESDRPAESSPTSKDVPSEDGSVRISLADAQAIYEALGEAYRMLSDALGVD